MQASFIFLIYLIHFTSSTLQKPSADITTFSQPSIRRARAPGSSGRLSLINYRFSRRPRRKNLDTTELKLALGSDFDPKFMSIDKPFDLTPTFVVRQDSWKFGEMLQELEARNLTQELQQVAGSGFQVQLEHVEMVEKWLMKKALCPVRYAWEDIGAMFWPRYIRRGECSSGQSSCSWPSGMHCVPSGTSNITILRWQCKTPNRKGRKRAYKDAINKDYKIPINKDYKGPINKDYKEQEKSSNLRCNWVRVSYPIISQCMCTC